jgi:uncharacterized protein (TIGR03435 family)
MFERYTERARRILFFARYEATQLGSTSIETEHLLLGLVREGKGLTSRLFERSHLSLEGIRREVEGRTVLREKVPTSVDIPFSVEAKRVLQYAAEEADRLRHTYVGSEHLLLGILREEHSLAASILADKGMRLASVRDAVVELINETSAPITIRTRVADSSSSSLGARTTESDLRQWTLGAIGLRVLLAKAYNVPETRIVLPADVDGTGRHDVTVTLAPSDDMNRVLQRALEQHFGIVITGVSAQPTDVYVLTAPDGIRAAIHPDEEGVSASTFDIVSHDIPGQESLAQEHGRELAQRRSEAERTGPRRDRGHIQRMSGDVDVDRLCDLLESELRRPVVNETGLAGRYRFHVQTRAQSNDEFIGALQEQTGLVVTPGVRDVAMLVVQKR